MFKPDNDQNSKHINFLIICFNIKVFSNKFVFLFFDMRRQQFEMLFDDANLIKEYWSYS